MSWKIVEVWAVYTKGDDRIRGDPTDFFSAAESAGRFSSGRGWYGGDAEVEKRIAVVVDDKVAYLIDREIDIDCKQAANRKILRQQAKSKLTPEELDALLEEVGK